MASWYLKAALQGGMSRLSNPHRWNRLFQLHITKGLVLTPEFAANKAAVVDQHLANWQRRHPSELPTSILELGTGWYPLVPVGLALRTGATVTTADIQPLLGEEETRATLEFFAAAVASDPATYRPEAPDRLAAALADETCSAADRLRLVGVDVRLEDARALSFATDSFDLITSNNTFEHIPLNDLAAILREFARVSKPTGVGSHLTDLADHYAGFDSSITVYNFLRYSDRKWSKYNNSLQYQNRLRWSEYREVITAAGWSIVDETVERDLEALEKVDIDQSFRRFDNDDLGIHTAWAVLAPTG